MSHLVLSSPLAFSIEGLSLSFHDSRISVEMEDYFNFEEASAMTSHPIAAPLNRGDTGQQDVNHDLNPMINRETTIAESLAVVQASDITTRTIPTLPAFSVLPYSAESFPVFKTRYPCDYCRQKGFDCFLAQRGTLQDKGCTACISLYRECSLTHKRTPGVWMATLDPVGEDVLKESGGVVGKAVMKSLPGGYTFDDGSGSRKSGGRFNRDAIKVLKSWLSAHAHHPYPTETEKDDLKHLTGLKPSQIANWMANARRRGKVPSNGDENHAGAVDIPMPTGPDLQDLTPFERWKVSPPEHEPANFSAIARAVSTNPDPAGLSSLSSSLEINNRSRQTSSYHRTSSNDESNFSMFQEPSISSFDTSRSANTSASSLQSGLSRNSLKSKKDRRRRRRTPITPLNQPQKYRGARIFQCTFCTETFSAKYDWTRHEKSLHLALVRWVCAPGGGVIEEAGIRRCVFCSAEDPDIAHLETHQYSSCEEKTPQERTFYRKDHLSQHLKLMHNCAFQERMNSWKQETTSIKSSCGFCPAEFSTWNHRADHLAAHFKLGRDMNQWKGTWGFEPHIERVVENAMPPYVIGEDRISVNPFVATRRLSSSAHERQIGPYNSSSGSGSTPHDLTSREDPYREDANCWRRCETYLSAYIQEELKYGRVPTNAQLQTRARLAVYGDDDPWNQSPADNVQWLSLVKKQNGLENGEDAALEAPRQANGDPATRVEELPLNPPYCIPGGLKKGKAAQASQSSFVPKAWTPSAGPAAGTCQRPLFDALSPLETGADQIDFSSLDFSALDTSFDISQTTAASFAPSYNAPELPMTDTLEFNDMTDVFADQGMELDLHSVSMTDTSGVLFPGMTSNPSAEDTMMDMNQLSEYMQSFRH